MSTIQGYLTSDHRRCDEVFSASEEAVVQKNWTKAETTLKSFLNSMEQHFTAEENVLFPTFEQATGMSGGPTMVMRAEHAQMRELFGQLNHALEEQDQDSFLGVSETLLIVMQQHNMKEENILYKMSDQVLEGSAREQVLKQMKEIFQG